jgi:hypothetical protein
MIAVWSEVCWLCDGCCVYVCARGNAGLCVAVAVLGWCLCFGAGLAGRGCFWLRAETRSSPSRDLGRTGIDQCRSVRAFLLAADWKTLAEIRNDARRSSLIR